MALFIIIAVGLAVAGLLWWLGRLSRGAMSLCGAALALGLVGYALQGSPNLAGSPVAAKPAAPAVPPETDARGNLIAKVGSEADTLAQADAYFRINRPDLAARVLRLALQKTPNSPGLWTGLGNAMVVHGGGLLSPAAEFCYRRALALAPGYPGALYFYAVALADNGRVDEARPVFLQLVQTLPAGSAMRAQLLADLTKNGLIAPAQGEAAKASK